MAIVKKLHTSSSKKTQRRKIGLGLELPKEKNVPATQIESYSWLIHGVRLIGKSSLAAQFKDSIMFCFEPGGESLNTYKVACPDWDHGRGYVALLEKEPERFKLVIIDTASLAYDRCLEYVCRQNNIDHPGGQKDYGKSWSLVRTEFESLHGRIAALGLGLIIIAHSKTADIETRSGESFNKVVPRLSSQADEFYAAITDNIIQYEYDGKKRFLTIQGDDFTTAGTRCTENFFTPDGRRIHRIPAGNSAREAYRNLVNAFNNKQTKTYEIKKEEEKPKVKFKKIKK